MPEGPEESSACEPVIERKTQRTAPSTPCPPNAPKPAAAEVASVDPCRWAKQCCAWQRQARYKWSIATPCCLANLFLEPLAPPVSGQACIKRLPDDARKDFWAFANGHVAKKFFEELLPVGGGAASMPPFFRFWWAWILRPELPEADRVPFTPRGAIDVYALRLAQGCHPWMLHVPRCLRDAMGWQLAPCVSERVRTPERSPLRRAAAPTLTPVARKRAAKRKGSLTSGRDAKRLMSVEGASRAQSGATAERPREGGAERESHERGEGATRQVPSQPEFAGGRSAREEPPVPRRAARLWTNRVYPKASPQPDPAGVSVALEPPPSARAASRQTSQPESEAATALGGDASSADQVIAGTSRVRYISWDKTKRRWAVQYEKHERQYFPACKWTFQGLTFEEAVAKAFEEAKCALANLRENVQASPQTEPAGASIAMEPPPSVPAASGQTSQPDSEAAPALVGDAPSADQVVAALSRVRNISWDKAKRRWIVSADNHPRVYFSAYKWTRQGLTFEEAVAKGFEAAKCALANIRENAQPGKEASPQLEPAGAPVAMELEPPPSVPDASGQTSQPDSAAAPALGDNAPSADQVMAGTSRVRYISWEKAKRRWSLQFEKHERLYFPACKWTSQGLTFEEAVAKAFEEAKCAFANLRENAQPGKEASPQLEPSGVPVAMELEPPPSVPDASGQTSQPDSAAAPALVGDAPSADQVVAGTSRVRYISWEKASRAI